MQTMSERPKPQGSHSSRPPYQKPSAAYQSIGNHDAFANVTRVVLWAPLHTIVPDCYWSTHKNARVWKFLLLCVCVAGLVMVYELDPTRPDSDTAIKRAVPVSNGFQCQTPCSDRNSSFFDGTLFLPVSMSRRMWSLPARLKDTSSYLWEH